MCVNFFSRFRFCWSVPRIAFQRKFNPHRNMMNQNQINEHASILVVDDEEGNRLLLRDPLEALGYRVSEATSGKEAFLAVEAAPPDLILLDVMMPELDGFEVCQRFKENLATDR